VQENLGVMGMVGRSLTRSDQLREQDDTRLGKFARIIANDGSTVTISMVRWGLIRRVAVRVFSGLLLTRFVPRHEIAIYRGPTTLTYNPYVTILIADEDTALARWKEFVEVIKLFGLEGLSIAFGMLDPLKEAWFSGIPGAKRQRS
jgi:hypothetical protein